MSSKALINRTSHEILSSKSKIDGTNYAINNGKTLIKSTGYNIILPITKVKISFSVTQTSSTIVFNVIQINGQSYVPDTLEAVKSLTFYEEVVLVFYGGNESGGAYISISDMQGKSLLKKTIGTGSSTQYTLPQKYHNLSLNLNAGTSLTWTGTAS